MKEYKVQDLRNVALLGHGSCGKTTLSEAMLYDAGAVTRMGRIEDHNTVSDYDEEEQERGLSVNTSVLPAEWQNRKLNILDVPGYMDFVGEVKNALRAADGGVLVVCASSGVEVGAELHWEFLDEAGIPRMVFVNKMDRDNADYARTVDQLRTKFEATFVPITLPIGARDSFTGIVDLVTMKAYLGAEGKEGEIPADMRDQVEAARTEMMEYAAEADDELMMKYLEGEELTTDEIYSALRTGSIAGQFVLVLAGSATKNIGVRRLLDAIAAYLPAPSDVERTATNPVTDDEVTLTPDPAAPAVAQVFKTLADPFVGKLTYFRVFSGTISSDSRIFNATKNEEERLGQLFLVRGKEQIPVDSIPAGDLGATAKLGVTVTSDTLCDRGNPFVLPPITYPEPLFSVAVFPKTKADLDKLGNGLSRLIEEDPTLRVERNTETNETILSGMGESHIQIAARRLAQKFGVEIVTEVPTIPYRETITKVAQAQGRHKKQTGGRGQFGDVWLRFEPLERGAGFEFASEIFGGAVPKNYVPAVEKGIREIAEQGVIAGFPTVDFRCVIYDGSYHPVDSSEMAFKLAAHLGFRNGIPQAGPVLLEPIMEIVVTVPEEFMGDILGDLNTRRGRVLGMEQSRGNGVVTAQVPLAEIQRYATDLRSMTQGRGIYRMSFSHYDIVPAHIVDKVVEETKKREAQRE
ncbi:MAG TPA: elongation factor G [Chloroflexi bacterium]|jgi:elongation factor G|nr:elongation factor G [Chloroflexota bacterium]